MNMTLSHPMSWWDQVTRRFEASLEQAERGRLEFDVLRPRIDRIAQAVQDRAGAIATESTAGKRLNDPIALSRTGQDRHVQWGELLGLQAARRWIWDEHPGIDLSTETLRQVHNQLYVGQNPTAGRFKTSKVYVTQIDKNAPVERLRLFPTTHPDQVGDEIDMLHERLVRLWRDRPTDRVIVAAGYFLDLLYIHPFHDGNGRTARHMFELMLLKAGHQAVPHLDLHRMFDRRRNQYLDAAQSKYDPVTDTLDPLPMLEFLTGLIADAYADMSKRIDRLERAFF